MKTKTITLAICNPPDFSTAEKLRMAVGLTLEDANKINALFIGEGACSVNGIGLGKNPSNMEIDKSIETLGMMGVSLFVHEPSLQKYSVGVDLYNILTLDDRGAADLLAASDVIIA